MVLFRDHQGPDTRTVGCHGLFLQAADGKHPAAQGYLTGHGHILPHRLSGQRAYQRRGHGHAGGRTVLRHRAFRHMDMNIYILVEILLEAQLFAVGPYPAECRFSGFLHYITQLARQFQGALAGHGGALHLQHFAAHAGIGQSVHNADPRLLFRRLAQVPGRSEHFPHGLLCHGHGVFPLVQHPHSRLTAKLGGGSFQRTYACLAGVILDHGFQHLITRFQGVRLHAVLFDLFGQQVPFQDLELFLFRIAGNLNQFHPVQQRSGNGFHIIGRGDEHHLAQVKGQLHIVIAEGVVLLGIQHFQHGGRRVTAEIPAHLVDLVKQEHRIAGTRLFHPGDDPSGDGTDIGPAMAADLRLIPDAAKADLDKLPANRLGDCFHNTGFAHAGRSNEAQDRSLHILFQAQHSQVLNDPFLDVLQAVMVPVQDFPGPVQVQVVLRFLAPGKVEDPLNIGLADRAFRTAGRHAGKPVQFLFALGAGFLVQRRFSQPFPKIRCIRFVPVAQFGLDRLDLLTQVIILLVLLHLFPDAGLDLLFRIRDVGFPHQDRADLFQPGHRIQFIQDRLAVFPLCQHIGCQQVRFLTGLVNRPDQLHGILAHPLGGLCELLKQILRGAQQRLRVRGADRTVFTDLDHSLQAGFFAELFLHNAPGCAFHEHTNVFPGQVHHLLDLGDGSDLAQVAPFRIFRVIAFLADKENLLLVHHSLFQRGQGLFPPHVKMKDHVRKEHQSPQG